jgi:hypothetical protein
MVMETVRAVGALPIGGSVRAVMENSHQRKTADGKFPSLMELMNSVKKGLDRATTLLSGVA